MKIFKASFVFIFLITLIVLTLSLVFAEEGYIQFGSGITEGKPCFNKGEIAYYIWKKGNTVHVRWTSNGAAHVFKGRITSDTALTNVVEVRTESEDYVVKPLAREIEFLSTTSTGVDGFSFVLNNPTRIRVALFVDGVHIDPSRICLGKDNSHPPGNPIIFYKSK